MWRLLAEQNIKCRCQTQRRHCCICLCVCVCCLCLTRCLPACSQPLCLARYLWQDCMYTPTACCCQGSTQQEHTTTRYGGLDTCCQFYDASITSVKSFYPSLSLFLWAEIFKKWRPRWRLFRRKWVHKRHEGMILLASYFVHTASQAICVSVHWHWRGPQALLLMFVALHLLSRRGEVKETVIVS